MYKRIDKQLFCLLALAFLFTTVIGTLSHELGHFIVARCLGYKAELNYAMTFHSATAPADQFIIRLGGPVQTMLTGTIGLICIWFSRNSFFTARQLSVNQWVLVFVALFWVRQPANLFGYLMVYWMRGSFPTSGDEKNIASYLLLPDWSLLFITALTGLIVLAVIVLKIIPVGQRLTFVSAGLVGGLAGAVLWFRIIGPVVMP